MAQITSFLSARGQLKFALQWTNPAGTIDHIRVVRKMNSAPTSSTDGDTFDLNTAPYTTASQAGVLWQDQSLPSFISTDRFYYRIFVHDGTSYGTAVGNSTGLAVMEVGASPISFSGTVLDQFGAAIVPGVDTWQVVITNTSNSLSGLGKTVTAVVDGSGAYSESLSFDNATDDLSWIADNIEFVIKKNSVNQFTITKAVSFSEVRNGSVLTDLQQPANQQPVAPTIPGSPYNVTPTNDTTPDLVWYHVVDPEGASSPIHYAVELSKALNGGQVDTNPANGYIYYLSAPGSPQTRLGQFAHSVDGVNWTSFDPGSADGLVATAGCFVRFTVPSDAPLTVDQWYWQVRATDKTPA